MIFEKFIQLLGEPFDRELLVRYIKYCHVKYQIEGNKIERHHIVPKSICKEWIREDFNIVPMIYKNHIEAHRMLVEIYPIRKFYRPLNYMLNFNKPEEYSKMKSKEVSDWWKIFRQSNEYEIWVEKRRKSTNGFEKFIEGGIKSSLKRNKSKKYREKISKSCKDFWNEEKKLKHSEKIKKAMTTEVRNKISKNSKEMWANRDEEYKKEFSRKMKDINEREDIKKVNSEKNKKHWESMEYRLMMKASRKNGKPRDVKSQSNKMKEKWKDPEFRKMMMERRKKK